LGEIDREGKMKFLMSEIRIGGTKKDGLMAHVLDWRKSRSGIGRESPGAEARLN
jgi:hypothetical protein